MIFWFPFLALVVGVAIGWLVARGATAPGPGSRDCLPADPHHVLDLLRRAHGAAFACLVRPDGGEALSAGSAAAANDLAERSAATARVALGDRRQHLIRDGHTIAAVGDGDLGIALAWIGDPPSQETLDTALADQRSLLGGFQAHGGPGWGRRPGAPAAATAAAPEVLESVAFTICQSARAASDCPAALVLRDAGSQAASIVAVSQGVDRRLLRSPVAPESVVGRASMGDVPIAGATGTELFGQMRSDRRRRDEQGIAYPLRDGRQAVGALVVFCAPDQLSETVQAHLARLAEENGPRLAVAAAIRNAETRAQTDELTGLWNRRALDRAMQLDGSAESALLLVDLDHFKRLNDSFGHTAGDAALRQVARILRGTLREQDLAARVGGEEFACWLPGTPLRRALEVAERVRTSIGATRLYWAGAELTITCSVGIAAKPDTVSQTANLYAAADAALYRAKEGGRNRIEVALPSR